MGTKQRPKPEKLAEKLLKIRKSLKLSQDELIEKMGQEGNIVRSTISQFERGVREPSYIVLLSYSKLANICSDYLIDDNFDLPENIPRKARHKK